jgi:hypothetical protein
MTWMSRRAFLAGMAGAAAAPLVLSASAKGASETVRLAVAGLHYRGPDLIKMFRKEARVRIVGLSDVDRKLLDAATKQAGGGAVRAEGDFRRFLDAPDVDAVVLATPDHWHALQTVWACQAGKDVYVEKPVSQNVWEGRQMLAAAEKYGRIVAAGLQNRSCTGLGDAFVWMKEGRLGAIRTAYGRDYPGRKGIGRVDGPQRPPATVDFDLFRGPAPLEPPRRRTFHYDWHWFWDTGTGDCGNRGVHTFDHTRWLMGETGLPRRVISIGGRFGWDDDGETPNTQVTLFDYEPAPMLWEMFSLPGGQGKEPGQIFHRLGGSMVLMCENGYLCGWRGGGCAFDADRKPVQRFRGHGGDGHYANFIEAVRSRKTEALRAPLRVGHVSSVLCHAANVSMRLGRHVSPGEARRVVADHEVLAAALDRMIANLEANGVDLAKTPLVLGPWVGIDPETERFTGEAADLANMYLRRTYRRPFVLPEEM